MSTRCHIRVRKDNEVCYIYHHYDGYPSGVGEELRKILKDCKDVCNFNNIVADIIKYDNEYEIDSGMHGDEDYLYEITINGEECTLVCESFPDLEPIFTTEYIRKCYYKKEDVMKIYKLFEEYGLIKDDLCFDPEHFIETVILDKLKDV